MMKNRILAWAALFLSPLQAAQEITFQPGHIRSILAVQFSPDDSQLISFSVSPDHQLCLWEVKTGRLLWATATGFVQNRYEYAPLTEFDWSKDGRAIVTRCGNGTYQVWDAKTGEIVSYSREKPDIKLTWQAGNDPRISTQVPGKAGFQNRIILSNGRTMQAETYPGREGSIRITDVPSGRSWWLEAHPGAVRDLAYSPDGSVLAVSGTDGNVYLFAAATRTLERTLVGHGGEIYSLVFGPDGKSLLTCDKAMGAKLWDWKTGAVLKEASLELGTRFRTFDDFKIDLSPDGQTFLVVGEGHGREIGLWKTSSLKPVRKLRVKERYRSTGGIFTSVSEF
ncbi:MAG: hypothetical protein HGA24_04295, partial [Candidatus Aminicenantes bacterium]|nr:hypothetical protein [Candidatus Aminicenantes bacterium]